MRRAATAAWAAAAAARARSTSISSAGRALASTAARPPSPPQPPSRPSSSSSARWLLFLPPALAAYLCHWQVDRKAWKEAQLARWEAALKVRSDGQGTGGGVLSLSTLGLFFFFLLPSLSFPSPPFFTHTRPTPSPWPPCRPPRPN